MKISNELYARILDNLYDGLYFVDKNRIITYWNAAAEKITGFSAKEVIGKSCSDNILNHVDGEGNSLCLGLCPLIRTISNDQPCEVDAYLHHKEGHRLPVAIRASILKDENGDVIGGIELFSDISHRAVNDLKIKELEKLALLDSLTQLANRNYIDRTLTAKLEEKKRLNIPFGIFFMDIDNFKQINDCYGHDVGDIALKLLANTFQSNSRPFDLYGRWGGDEFVGIISNITRTELEELGNRIRQLVKSAFFFLKNEKLAVSISVGATLAEKKDTIDSLIKRADLLLYKSKEGGRDRLTIG